MEIPPIGISSTAAAIQRGQARFDSRAQRVTDEAEALSSDQPSADEASSQLPADLAGLQTDAISNEILFKVFRRQQELQGEAADLIRPK